MASVLVPPSWSSAAGQAAKSERVVLGVGARRYEWVKGWGTLPSGMQLGPMHGGVAVDSQKQVYLSTDGEGSIVVFDRDGKFVRSIGKEWRPEKEGSGTHDIQVNKEGAQEFIYLVSLFRHEFAKLTIAGEVVWVKGFPEQSGIYKSKDEFAPTGIAVAPNGDVYVADGYGKDFIHRYNPKGEYIASW
ncbi:MAG TPA: peptidase, partial [Vicinamibacteria bacterium]|nr:peptidase [Vicinamibacteria bacterium]